MNTNDPFEQRLRRQPLRPVPPIWREEILGRAGRAADIASPAVRYGPLLRWWAGAVRQRLWPSPAAWAGLAALWGLIAVLNLAAGGAAEPAALPASAGPARQFWQMLTEQGRVLAELEGVPSVSEPGPARVSPQVPHSRGVMTILNT